MSQKVLSTGTRTESLLSRFCIYQGSKKGGKQSVWFHFHDEGGTWYGYGCCVQNSVNYSVSHGVTLSRVRN